MVGERQAIAVTAPMPIYYRHHAQAYADATRSVDMTPLYARFTPHLPPQGHVLDVGCGSGRDALAFARLGYRVTAFDASPELAQLAAQHTGLPVVVAEVLALEGPSSLGLPPGTLFDGIWACASPLHVAEAWQPQAWARLWALLRPGGVAYASYKVGTGERVDDLGRPFTDATAGRVSAWLADLPGVAAIDTWMSSDLRAGEGQAWLNTVVKRSLHA